MTADGLTLRGLLLRNTGVQVAGYAASIGLGLVSAAVLSRCLGVEGFGQLNYVFAFYFVFLAASDFGISVVVIREASQLPERTAEIVGNMLSLKVLLSLALAGVALAVVWTGPFEASLRTALSVYALILPLLAFQLPGVIFQVSLQLQYAAMVGLFNRALGTGLAVGLAWAGFGLVAVVAALVLSEALSLAVLLVCARRHFRPVWRAAPALWRQVLRSSVPLGLAGLFAAVINRVDFLMLERMTDLREVGLYAAAYKVTNLLETLPLMVMATVYPLMSRYAAEDLERLRNLYRKSVLLLGLVGVPLGIAVTVTAPLIVRALFGQDFAGAAPALAVLVWSTTFLYLAIGGGNLLISMGRERLNLAIAAIGAVVNVTLNLYWIPAAGSLGAAWATTTTFFVILLCTTAGAWSCLRPGAPLAHEPLDRLPVALPRER